MYAGSPLARCASVCVRQAVTSAPLAQNVFPAVWTAPNPLMPDRLLRYGPRRATERFQEYRTSLDVTGSPLENFTFCFSFTVTVIPSAEIPPLAVVGTSTAISGMVFNLSSNRQRLSYTFCTNSESTSASSKPGSHVLGSWRTGKCRTWFAARPPPLLVLEPPPHAATVSTPAIPRHRPPILNLDGRNSCPP